METPWARLAVNFYRHPRIRRLSKDAQHLYLASILHCVEFKTDGRFPADETPLLASFSRVRSSLADELFAVGLWEQDDDDVVIRDFLEWQTSAEERNAKSEAGRKGAQVRWDKERANGNGNRNAGANGRGANAEGEVEKEKRPPSPPGFDDFWNTYPRREGKRAALKVFPKAVNRAGSVDVVLEGARRYAENVGQRKVEQEFIAHPTTWLNQDRWEDELPEPRPEEPAEDPYR